MSWRVWKWTFSPVGPRQAFVMPVGSRVVHVAEDPALPFVALWTQHVYATQADTVVRTFELVGTGHATEHTPDAHVGTAVLSNGLVLHVYEVTS